MRTTDLDARDLCAVHVFSGPGHGEVLALRWQDVDIEALRVHDQVRRRSKGRNAELALEDGRRLRNGIPFSQRWLLLDATPAALIETSRRPNLLIELRSGGHTVRFRRATCANGKPAVSKLLRHVLGIGESPRQDYAVRSRCYTRRKCECAPDATTCTGDEAHLPQALVRAAAR